MILIEFKTCTIISLHKSSAAYLLRTLEKANANNIFICSCISCAACFRSNVMPLPVCFESFHLYSGTKLNLVNSST